MTIDRRSILSALAGIGAAAPINSPRELLAKVDGDGARYIRIAVLAASKYRVDQVNAAPEHAGIYKKQAEAADAIADALREGK